MLYSDICHVSVEHRPARMSFVFLRYQEPDEVTITQFTIDKVSNININIVSSSSKG